MHKQRPYLTRFAREMRQEPTNAEAILWWELRGKTLGVRFRRQVPIGRYIADFACFSHRIIVEVDGLTHNNPEVCKSDLERDTWFETHGWKVLRVTDDEVWEDRDAVVQWILNELNR